MSDFSKINYYDLKLEAASGRLPLCIGRTEEMERLNRIVSKNLNNNCVIVGEAGIGKTSFLYGWSQYILKQPVHAKLQVVQTTADSFTNVQSPIGLSTKYSDAFSTVSSCVFIIDDFGRLVYGKPAALQGMVRLIQPLLANPEVRVVLIAEPQAWRWVIEQDPSLANALDLLTMKEQSSEEYLKIMQQAVTKFQKTREVNCTDEALDTIITLCQRFSKLGALPGSAIRILDEVIGASVALNNTTISDSLVQKIVADKTGIPMNQLAASELDNLKSLHSKLAEHVIGQDQALLTITNMIQRAKLGLKNPNRPLGSFLVLGPSGVGKTETAKTLAELVYGSSNRNFIRIDMSEFGEANTVPRLIGAPPGYVGFEAGGGLTNPIQDEPYSLVLLDEIEKAHPKIFDVFLQVLDDGRITSGQGETVDFTQTIIMATSNLAVDRVLEGYAAKEDIYGDAFIRTHIVPLLTQHFRTEFINRFDAIILFKPLTHDDLVGIALLEIQKIEQRVKKHKIKFNIDPAMLSDRIRQIADPRFGARPVKRFIEETCETLITQALLK